MANLIVSLTYKEANAAAAYLAALLVFYKAMPDPDTERGRADENEVRGLIKKLEQE